MLKKGVLVGVLASTVVTFVLSGIWYGMVMKDAWTDAMNQLGISENSESASTYVIYIVCELLRALLVGYVLSRKPATGKDGLIVGATVGFLACTWMGVGFLMFPWYTQTLFLSDILVGGAVMTGISGWVIGFCQHKLQ